MNSNTINDSGVSLKGEKTINTQFRKFDKAQWNKIEVLYGDQITIAVLDAMKLLGNPNAQINERRTHLKYCGDDYDELRPLLVKRGLVDDLSKDNKKQSPVVKKKLSKKDEIIRTNTLAGVTKNIKDTLQTYSNDRFNGTYGFNSSYAEVKMLTCIYGVKFLMNKRIPNIPQCYELALGIRKILNNIIHFPQISHTAINDLTFAYQKLLKFCNFTYNTMFDKFPRLCLMTGYDTIFPSMAIKPYSSQLALMNTLKRISEGLILYQAMISNGKTTLMMALCSYMEILRQIQKAQSQPTQQIIFACSVEPVRHQVCKMAYNQGIPFGIGIIENNSLRVINNYSCKQDENRILIVADLDATIELLNRSQNYLLFVDEPTVGADQTDHPITKAVCKIIALCPKTIILCSATLPCQEEIPEIISYYKTRHNNNNIESVCSKDSLIGCEIINFDGSTIAPHNDCNTVDELKKIVKNLKDKPFIDRLYTAPVVYRLRQKMIDNGILDVIDLETYFSNVCTLSQSNIQKAAIELLDKLIEKNNDMLVERICKPLGKIVIEENSATIEQEPDIDEGGFKWEEPKLEKKKVESVESYNLDEIFTKQSYRYLGGCLVATNDPLKFAFDASRVLLEKCDTASKIISKYKTLEDKFNTSLQNLMISIPSNDKSNKSNKSHQKLDKIKNDDERTKAEQSVKNEHHPTINYPAELRVNTISHLKRYAPHMISAVEKKQLQQEFDLTSIPLTFNVPDWVMLLLFAGVGIYAPNNQTIDNNYTDYILNMTADGKLSFLISDDNICYGANYPFSHVVILEDLAEKHSIGTIFQLIGRAGRVAQSWVAYAHVADTTSKRIINYMRGIESIGITEEAKNMISSFKTVLEEIDELKKNKQNDKPIFEETDKTKRVSIIKLSEVKPKEPVTIQKPQDTLDSWEEIDILSQVNKNNNNNNNNISRAPISHTGTYPTNTQSNNKQNSSQQAVNTIQNKEREKPVTETSPSNWRGNTSEQNQNNNKKYIPPFKRNPK